MKPIPEQTVAETQDNLRRFRRMVRNIGKLIPCKEDEVERASGQAICKDCGLELRDHPVTNDGITIVDCNSRFYHL